MNSLLRLEQCQLDRLEIAGRHVDGEATDEGGVVTVSFDLLGHREHPNWHKVTARFEVDWPETAPSPFATIKVHLGGIFTLPEETPLEETAKYVPLLCLTTLYGIARGVVAQSTGMCEGGSYLLPVVDMNKVLRSAIEEQQKPKPRTRKAPAAKRAPARKKATPKAT